VKGFFLFARTGIGYVLFEKVYEIVKKIPAGKVATYGQIARLLGTPERAKLWGGPFIKIHIMVKFPVTEL